MEELKTRVEKFITDNKLKFGDIGSGLNGNCTILAGFICFVFSEEEHSLEEGVELIYELNLPTEAEEELLRVFDFAWYNNYEKFWETSAAKKQYVF